MRMPLISLLLATTLVAAPAMPASLASDLFEEAGPEGAAEQSLIDGVLPDVLGTMSLANREYAEVENLLEEGLRDQANYATILELAPQLIQNAPNPDRVRWMLALALAATGEMKAAQGVIAQVTQPEAEMPLAYLAQAMLARRQGDNATAIELTRKAILKQPTYAYAYNLMGTIKAELGEIEEATEWFAQATIYSGTSAIYWRNLGILKSRQSQLTEAAQALERALILAPNDCVALMASAELYEANQQSEKAEGFVTRCIEKGTGNRIGAVEYLLRQQFAQDDFERAAAIVDAHEEVLEGADLIRAEIALQTNKPDAALALLENVAPGRARDLRRVLALAMRGAPDAALDLLREMPIASAQDATGSAFLEVVLSIATGQAPRTYALGLAKRAPALEASSAWYEALWQVVDDPRRAPDIALKADDMLAGMRFVGIPLSDWLVLQDDALRAEMALGMLWLLRDYKQAAVSTFDQISAQAEVQQAAYFAAFADFQRGAVDAAKQRLAPVAEAHRDYFSVQVLMAEIHLRYGAFGDALRHYQEAARVVSDSGILMRVGVLADMEDKPDEAERALRRFIALNPVSYVGYNQLAWVFIQREMRLDEALELARKADELQPGNASILDNIGWVMFLQGDPKGAAEMLREANTRSGNANPDILYHLAAVEAALGSDQTAKGLLARLFKAAPEDHPAVIAGRDLGARLN